MRNSSEKSNTIELSLMESTGDFWVDNGLVVLYDLFGEGEYDFNDLLSKLVSLLAEKTGKEGYYYNLNAEKFERYDKENWRYPTNLFIKSNPTPDKLVFDLDKCEKDGDYILCDATKKNTKDKVTLKIPEEMRNFVWKNSKKGKKGEVFLEIPKRSLSLSIERNAHVCSICGKYGKTSKGKQWMYPFLVDPSKFGNFYSSAKGANYLCPSCALAGLAAYLGWIYAVGGKDYMHIFVFHSDLNTMYSMRKGVIKPLSLTENKGRNFPMAFFGKYIHETTMGLILELFKKLKIKEDVDPEIAEFLEEKLTIPTGELKLFAISGKPGKGFNMSGIVEFSKFNALYNLYTRWLETLSDRYPEEPSVIDIINHVFEQFYIKQQKQSKKAETIWRDKICWMLMEFKDPFPYIESFIFEKEKAQRGDIKYGLRKGTIVVFEEYAKEVLKMDEKDMNIVAAFGHDLGRTCAIKDDMGILYSLRNSKNIDDFLKVLNDINFKLGLTVNERLLRIDGNKIMGQPWERIKTLLSIYAMNQYLWMKNKGGDRSGK